MIQILKEPNCWRKLLRFKHETKKIDDILTLVLTYHQALNQLCEILGRAHKHVLKSPRRHRILPFIYKWAGANICSYCNCITVIICKAFEKRDQFERTILKKIYLINFPFDYNSSRVVYLLAC